MTKMAEEEFAITGLAPSYAFLLMSVNEKPGIQPKGLSEQMQLSPSTVTRLIEKMELRGFVERKSMGRVTEVYPTVKSKELDPKIKEAWQNLYKRYSGIIGKEADDLTGAVYSAVKKLRK
jgi:DNA-binding MarR family transcriptional regulator